MIAVATLALVWAGALHWVLGAVFCASLVLSWRLEGGTWQLSERTGLILVLLSIPIFYLDWSYQAGPRFIAGDDSQTQALVGAIAHLITALSAIKLFQVKSDRDWVFLYLISFFEILLAAGLSFSPIYLVSLAVYLVCGVSTVVAFEIHKARRKVKTVETRLLVSRDERMLRLAARRARAPRNTEIRRLPIVSVVFLVLITVLALPLFLVAPRAGSAAFTRSGSGLTNFIGFSENVQLGEIGTLKENDQVVMHVRLDGQPPSLNRELRWRGVALDEFTGKGWKKSIESHHSERRVEERCGNSTPGCGVFPLDTSDPLHRLTTQTIFLEPLDSPVVFAAPRAVAVQGPFSFVRQDLEGSIQSRRHESERLIYKAVSDTTEPDAEVLRHDLRSYPVALERYVQLPASIDPRIKILGRTMVTEAGARNVYDAAKAIETRLQRDYGYTLEMKSSGPDPLADFLFNVRAGHCEYFSTAMAVLLRSQHIPARVVNGFLSGDYNSAAGAYTVRQSDAHSWVEVYFAETNSWVTFDPTPAAGRLVAPRTGIAAMLGKYAEAMELMWFQYVIGYDKQEQRSLATSLNNRLFRYRHSLANDVLAVRSLPAFLWRQLFWVVAAVAAIFLLVLLLKRAMRVGWRQALKPNRERQVSTHSAIEFYERLTRLLAARGLKRGEDQTPREFAAKVGSREVIGITEIYNRVRFGSEHLAAREAQQIEQWLLQLETSAPVSTTFK